MKFANNLEAMGFDKTGWAEIEVIADGVNETVYMGKPLTEDATGDDNVWCIKRIETVSAEDGSQRITTKYARDIFRCAWNRRKEYQYKYNLR